MQFPRTPARAEVLAFSAYSTITGFVASAVDESEMQPSLNVRAFIFYTGVIYKQARSAVSGVQYSNDFPHAQLVGCTLDRAWSTWWQNTEVNLNEDLGGPTAA